MKLNDSLKINKKICKNRLLMPPLVCANWGDAEGYETVSRAEHYALRAKGTGLIIIEATAISKAGRLSSTELGLWEDGQIKQFEDIAAACHQHKSLVLVQLVHAGFQAVTDVVYSASADTKEGKKVKALSLEEIHIIKEDFVKAAVRAYKAGLDGVEIHGAHTYLLNQFTALSINHRTDQYGGTLEKRCQLPLEIVHAVRQATSEDFILAYRFGVNDESFKEDIYLLEALDKAGVDFFDVSIGFSTTNIEMPEDFEESPITYMGVKLSQYTQKPLACVYGIRKGEQAKRLVEKYHVPMVAVGKGLLADPQWSEKVLNDLPVDVCYNCQPKCKYGIDGHTCPYRKTEA